MGQRPVSRRWATGLDHARRSLEAKYPQLRSRQSPTTAEAIDTLRRFADLGADPCLPHLNPDTPKPLEREIVDHENMIRLWLAPHIDVILNALTGGDQENT